MCFSVGEKIKLSLKRANLLQMMGTRFLVECVLGISETEETDEMIEFGK